MRVTFNPRDASTDVEGFKFRDGDIAPFVVHQPSDITKGCVLAVKGAVACAALRLREAGASVLFILRERQGLCLSFPKAG